MMSDKKILILVMSCTLPYYRKKELSIRKTWAKPVLEGKYSNIDLWFFNSATKDCIDVKTHRIFTVCDDRRDRTFQKLCKTLKLVNERTDIFEYDYIFRVNISTVLNVDLLDEFIQHLENDIDVWSCTTFNQTWVANNAPFFSGECFALSRRNVSIVLDFYQKNISQFDALEADKRPNSNFACDDGWLTIIFSRYFGDDYEKRFKTFGIVYEPFSDLRFSEKYSTHIAITHKTFYLDKKKLSNEIVSNIDKYPVYEELDERKREKISEFIKNEFRPGEWWEYFNEKILDKECRLSLNREDDAFCPKHQIFENWRKEVTNG